MSFKRRPYGLEYGTRDVHVCTFAYFAYACARYIKPSATWRRVMNDVNVKA